MHNPIKIPFLAYDVYIDVHHDVGSPNFIHISTAVAHVLDQMLRYDIIRKANERLTCALIYEPGFLYHDRML